MEHFSVGVQALNLLFVSKGFILLKGEKDVYFPLHSSCLHQNSTPDQFNFH